MIAGSGSEDILDGRSAAVEARDAVFIASGRSSCAVTLPKEKTKASIAIGRTIFIDAK
jgi:hypothetical protein